MTMSDIIYSTWESMWIKKLCKDNPDEVELDYLDKMRKVSSRCASEMACGGVKFNLMMLIEIQYSIKRLKKRKSFQRFTYNDLLNAAKCGER